MASGPEGSPFPQRLQIERREAEKLPRAYGIQSIGRAFAILEEVACNRHGISLADLSRCVGLHNSTTFHIVRTMVSLGYIRRIEDTKRYRIGQPLFALAAGAFDEVEMASAATIVLEDLSRETGESAHFATWLRDAVIVIAKASGSGVFHLAERVGIVRPAYCTALGKINLAALPADEFESYLKRIELKPCTNKTITDPQRLRGEIEMVRQAGVAYDDGEFDEEVRCVAMAARDFRGNVIGAIGISGSVWRLSMQALHSHNVALRRAAAQLSGALGNNDENK